MRHSRVSLPTIDQSERGFQKKPEWDFPVFRTLELKRNQNCKTVRAAGIEIGTFLFRVSIIKMEQEKDQVFNSMNNKFVVMRGVETFKGFPIN